MFHSQRNSIKKYTYKNTGIPQATIARPNPKVNSVFLDDPYGHINPMENTYEYTHLIDI